jgi:hypothetical protein
MKAALMKWFPKLYSLLHSEDWGPKPGHAVLVHDLFGLPRGFSIYTVVRQGCTQYSEVFVLRMNRDGRRSLFLTEPVRGHELIRETVHRATQRTCQEVALEQDIGARRGIDSDLDDLHLTMSRKPR